MSYSDTEIKLAWANGKTVQAKLESDTKWYDWPHNDELDLKEYDFWRIKPETVTILGKELPKPVKTIEVKTGKKYYLANSASIDGSMMVSFENDYVHLGWLEKGLLHTTKENAQAWIDFFVSLAAGAKND